MLNTNAEDPCCAKRLSKMLESGKLDEVNTWICPKCGCQWRPRIVNGELRHWEPHEVIALLRV